MSGQSSEASEASPSGRTGTPSTSVLRTRSASDDAFNFRITAPWGQDSVQINILEFASPNRTAKS